MSAVSEARPDRNLGLRRRRRLRNYQEEAFKLARGPSGRIQAMAVLRLNPAAVARKRTRRRGRLQLPLHQSAFRNSNLVVRRYCASTRSLARHASSSRPAGPGSCVASSPCCSSAWLLCGARAMLLLDHVGLCPAEVTPAEPLRPASAPRRSGGERGPLHGSPEPPRSPRSPPGPRAPAPAARSFPPTAASCAGRRRRRRRPRR